MRGDACFRIYLISIRFKLKTDGFDALTGQTHKDAARGEKSVEKNLSRGSVFFK